MTKTTWIKQTIWFHSIKNYEQLYSEHIKNQMPIEAELTEN